MQKKQSSETIRVYEYIDEDGNVFWSFSETVTRVSVTKLELVDRVGLPFRRWVYELGRMVRLADRGLSMGVPPESPLEGAWIVQEKNWGKKK